MSARPPSATALAEDGRTDPPAKRARSSNAERVLVHNALIYSSFEASAEAIRGYMEIEDGRIRRVCEGEPRWDEWPAEKRVDLGGATVVPGLIDSHIHVAGLGQFTTCVDFSGCASIVEMQRRLREWAEAHNEAKWVVGRGWEQHLLGRYPTRFDLDAVVIDRPVLLWRTCMHVAVANSRALQIVGIDADTVDPRGGMFDRVEGSSDPSGLAREHAAELLMKHVSQNDKTLTDYVVAGLKTCLSLGVTTVQTNDAGYWRIYKGLAEKNELPIRVFLTLGYDDLASAGPDADRPPPHTKIGSMLTCRRVKLFADGSLGADTAALSRPYLHLSKSESKASAESDNAEWCGVLILSQEEMTHRVQRIQSEGFMHEVHVIGDRAADVALTAFEACGLSAKDRPLLTHCQVLRQDLIDRMARIGVIANIQPQFVVSDSRWAAEKLHADLLKFSYAWATLLRRGVRCAGGSDAPIEWPNPLLGIHAAVFRPRGMDGNANPPPAASVSSGDSEGGNSWRVEECVGVREAFHLYTAAGCYAVGEEAGTLGVLAPGAWADFVVLDRDVVSAPSSLPHAVVQQVWVAGVRRKCG